MCFGFVNNYYILHLIALFIIVLIVFIVVYFLQKRKWNSKSLYYKETISLLKLQNIRNRISPHFILNIVSGLNCASGYNEKLNLLSFLLRRSIEMSDEKLISLQKELDFINVYIELEKYNLGESFTFIVDNKCQDTEKIFIPPMFIHILIENAIKHALRKKEGEKRLFLSLDNFNKGVKVEIKDNGTSAKSCNSFSNGNGLTILFQTIDYLNRKNKQHVVFEISKVPEFEGEGTIVKLFIPFDLKM